MTHLDSLWKLSSLCVVEKDTSSQFYYYFFSHFLSHHDCKAVNQYLIRKCDQIVLTNEVFTLCKCVWVVGSFHVALLLFTRLGLTCLCAHSPCQKARCGELIQPLSGYLISKLFLLNIFWSAGLLLALNLTILWPKRTVGLLHWLSSKFSISINTTELGGFYPMLQIKPVLSGNKTDVFTASPALGLLPC